MSPSPLRLCYRQAVAYRYVIMSILAITFVVVISLQDEETQNVSQLYSQDELPRARGGSRPQRNIGVKGYNGSGHDGLDHSHGTHCPAKGQPTQVILLTYGRSGSSLTADILEKHEDVFYHYEPLHNLAKSFTDVQREYNTRYQKRLYLTAISDYNKETERVCELLLTCNFTHLPPPAYWNLHLIQSKNTRPIHTCIKSTLDDEFGGKEDPSKVQDCLRVNSARCTLKPFRLIKTIRMTAESVGNLMARLPNLKMIYLVRDPRGSYLSKLKAFPSDFSRNATFEALRICPRLKKDIDATWRLYKKHPHRVHITRYESIAEDPVETARKLYQFLCLDFTKSIQNYILHNVMAGNNKTDKNIYSVRRQDPKAASYAWRSKMDIGQAVSFDDQCGEVYEKLGYLPVDNEEHLRDLDSPLKMDVEGLL